MKKLEKLEAVRGFTAIYILVMHLHEKGLLKYWGIDFWGFNVDSFFRFGQQAVLIFFILSGFVIQYSFSRTSDKSFKKFFFKRFTRIYIPLLAVFLVSAILYNSFGMYDNFSWKLFLGNLMMLQDTPNKPGVICNVLYWNGPLWSLSYEWWYYMFYFVLVTYIMRNNKRSYFIYVLIIIAAISHHFYIFSLNRLLIYMSLWWLGRDMAVVYSRGDKIGFKNLAFPLGTVFACFIILWLPVKLRYSFTSAYVLTQNYMHIGYMCIFIVFVLLWYKANWPLYRYLVRPFRHFASISYVIYIAHFPLIIQARYLDFIENIALRYILYFIIFFSFAYFIERILFVRVSAFLEKKLFHQTNVLLTSHPMK